MSQSSASYESQGFLETLRRGQLALGAGISFTDPTVTECLNGLLDFVWIDMEHNPLSLETVLGHVMATKGSHTTPLVRVPCNEPVIIKQVLDQGAAGVIAPMVRNAEEAQNLVAACRYPPDGIRGFGPRRPSGYGRRSGPDYCRQANESVIVIAQLEHLDTVSNIDAILQVEGLTSVVLGPQDLAGSMGHMGEPAHPQVMQAAETIIQKAKAAGVYVGAGLGGRLEQLQSWIDRGLDWLQIGNDYTLMLQGVTELAVGLRGYQRE